MVDLTDLQAWQVLSRHAQESRHIHMSDLFSHDPQRYPRYTVEACGLLLDYSKNRITDKTLAHLFALAGERDLEKMRDSMFAGEHINLTEDRAVLHTALRRKVDNPAWVDGVDVMPAVARVLQQMRRFTDAIRSGEWIGCDSGAKLRWMRSKQLYCRSFSSQR